ncbi:methyltransferase [Sphingobium sp. DEHP117]|uniref:class I SAM-dependent methyltransferase n=1 Tax=Sphingobium sp. DEHP117 TaxID=2993436 RepID=UPI0027D6F797|nr:methyltransferase [Sphingobium sp. DEHP117]MDQ4421309.1 methyltransferase [Sphingobium sp. DEHP117]
MPRLPKCLALAAMLPLAFSVAPLSAQHHGAHIDPAIAAAVASSARTPENMARDKYRHPAETLTFFGVKPSDTVLEFNPGGGWYTEILTPVVAGHGHYIGTQAPGAGLDKLKARFTGAHIRFVDWPVGDVIPAGSVDTILTFRNVHNLVMKDAAPAAFATFFKLLKPGGTLGVVDHRLPETRDSAMEKTSGYLKLSTVRKLAEDAGFVLEAQSEINANPKDSADWEKGVWTLPPTLTNGAVDRDKYLAIGESDRMTLRFRKPKS